MTQYVINIGAVANDGTGDPLRTAFNEVNLNFDQVFAAGPVLSNIQIANNTILTTNTNGNLVLAPNGVGVVQANVNIVPNTANIRNLGAANRRWSTLYIQYANISGAITVADLTATGNVTVGGNLSVTGNVINIGNIVTDAKTIQLANTAGTANAASGSGITVGANDAIATMLYSSATNAWTFNIGVDTPNIVVNNISSDDSTFVTIQDGLDVQGDITAETVSVTGNVTANYFIGNGSQLTGVSNYANANAVAYGQAGWAGNIVPAASNTYSLGNSTNWWSNVWVAGNTMYIGGVPIGMGAGNTLTVDGNSVVTVSSNTTANLANIGIDNNNIFNNQGQGVVISNFSFIDEAETAYVQIPAGNSTANLNIVQKQGNVRIAANAAAWLFDDTGNLTLPTNGSIVVDGGDGVIGPVSDDFVISWDNEEIRLVSVQGSIEMQADAAFRVQTNYDGANVLYASRWEFSNNELVNISNNFGIVSEAGNLTLSGGRDGVNSGNTIISAVDLGSAVYNWTFGNTGNLTLPGAISAVGNITGNYFIGNGSQLTGLPAGYANSDVANFMAAFGSNSISTTGNVTANNISGNILVTGNVTGTTPNVTLIAGSYSWTFDNTGVASFPAVGGDEGGEINFAIPTANTTLTGPVKVDVYRDQLRFFDGSTNGAYLDLANCPSSVSTAIGYRDIPQISFTGNTTIVANAAGRHYYSTQSTDYVLTIANNTSVGWSVGTAITIVNRGTGNMTIAQGTGVSLYLAGNSTAGNRTVTTYGMATLLNVAANVWMINGTGVS